MKITPLYLRGAYVIDLEKREDDRGFFARSFCVDELKKVGINFVVKQGNVSRSVKKGTLRGLHYQKPPFGEDKLIRCTKGAVYDVIVDLRQDSPTYKKWYGTELSEENYRQMFVPKGFAHGHMTLRDDSELTYFVSEFYTPKEEGGILYNDEEFKIVWPLVPTEMSAKDMSWPNFTALTR